jgi:short subunit dehydrogenase-like uncharacterized protein
LIRNPFCQVALNTQAELLPEGPLADERAPGIRAVVVEADDRAGGTVRARLRTPEAYRFTAATALTVAARVLGNDWAAGVQTPAGRYGADFVLGIEGVRREDRAD